jgi:hypothetical protein
MTFCNLNSAGNFFNTSLNPITFARFLSHKVDFYQQHAQRAVFVGHPLAESLHPRQDYQSTKTVLIP